LDRNGYILKRTITADEDNLILSEYEKHASIGKLEDLAKIMGRTKSFICRRARLLGLTNQHRPNVWSPKKIEKPKPPKKEFVHPRGMLGKKHTAEMKQKLSDLHKNRAAKLPPEHWKEQVLKSLKTRMERYGTTSTNPSCNRSWKCGWRVIGGENIFFRSRWEANYARYLEYLKERGEILEWKHEPKLFLFKDAVKATSYLPDFLVITNDGHSYHEVKGWMDDRSIEKLRLMSEFYPEETIVLIDAKWFKKNETALKCHIDGWEHKKDYEVRNKSIASGEATDD
jgi:hypothetical protein